MDPPRSCLTCSGPSPGPTQSASVERRLLSCRSEVPISWRLLKRHLRLTSYPNITFFRESSLRIWLICESVTCVPPVSHAQGARATSQRIIFWVFLNFFFASSDFL